MRGNWKPGKIIAMWRGWVVPIPPLLLAPTVIRLLNDTDLPDRIDPPLPLPDKHINLPQHRHYFFWLRSSIRHL